MTNHDALWRDRVPAETWAELDRLVASMIVYATELRSTLTSIHGLASQDYRSEEQRQWQRNAIAGFAEDALSVPCPVRFRTAK